MRLLSLALMLWRGTLAERFFFVGFVWELESKGGLFDSVWLWYSNLKIHLIKNVIKMWKINNWNSIFFTNLIHSSNPKFEILFWGFLARKCRYNRIQTSCQKPDRQIRYQKTYLKKKSQGRSGNFSWTPGSPLQKVLALINYQGWI